MSENSGNIIKRWRYLSAACKDLEFKLRISHKKMMYLRQENKEIMELKQTNNKFREKIMKLENEVSDYKSAIHLT